MTSDVRKRPKGERDAAIALLIEMITTMELTGIAAPAPLVLLACRVKPLRTRSFRRFRGRSV